MRQPSNAQTPPRSPRVRQTPVPPPEGGWTRIPTGWTVNRRTGWLRAVPSVEGVRATLKELAIEARTTALTLIREARLGLRDRFSPSGRGNAVYVVGKGWTLMSSYEAAGQPAQGTTDMPGIWAWLETAPPDAHVLDLVESRGWDGMVALLAEASDQPLAVRQRLFRAFLRSAIRRELIDDMFDRYPTPTAQLFAENPSWTREGYGRRLMHRVLAPPAARLADWHQGVYRLTHWPSAVTLILRDPVVEPAVVSGILQAVQARWAAMVAQWRPFRPVNVEGRAESLLVLKKVLGTVWAHPALLPAELHVAAGLSYQMQEAWDAAPEQASVVAPPPPAGPARWRALLLQQPVVAADYLTRIDPAVWAEGLTAKDLRPLLLHADATTREQAIRLLPALLPAPVTSAYPEFTDGEDEEAPKRRDSHRPALVRVPTDSTRAGSPEKGSPRSAPRR